MCLKVSLYEKLREYFEDYLEDGRPNWRLLSKVETIYKQLGDECPTSRHFLNRLNHKQNSDELYNISNKEFYEL